MDKPYRITIIDFEKQKKEVVKVLIAQPTWTEKDWTKVDGMYFHSTESSVANFVDRILGKAKDFGVDFVIFPELSIPESLITIIMAWANQNDCIVIAGSHYKNTERGYIAKAPIIYANNIYYSEKIVPAPSEISPIRNEGLQQGENLLIFKNTQIGTFSLLICADYLSSNVKLKDDLLTYNLDFLFVPAFQRDSCVYHDRMHIDCQNSEDGLYIVYANNKMPNLGDGDSALFAVMDNTFREKLIGRTTDGKPTTKIIEITNEKEFIALEVDLKHKKPTLGKTVHTRPNVEVLTPVEKPTIPLKDIAPKTKEELISKKNQVLKNIESLIAKHGLDDSEWIKAPSSQLFLVNIAHSLKLIETDEYKNLINEFYKFFTPNYDDSLSLIESRVLITPDENIRIVECMQLEDKMDSYFANSTKTMASNISPTLLHQNYLYGVALGISGKQTSSSFMMAVANSAINYLIYKKQPSALDNHGGWYPYRVPWITARILTSLSTADLSKRPDIDNIKNEIEKGLDSLAKRLINDGYWRSGVGDWVTKWESTALCLEAFINADAGRKYKIVINSLIDNILNSTEWLNNQPDFSSEETSNNTLATILIMSVLLQSNQKYELDNTVNLDIQYQYLDFFNKVIVKLLENNKVNPRQFSTVPQIVSYCLNAISI